VTTAAHAEYAVTFDDICEAARRIAPFARRTPVETCGALDRRAGRRLFFKCEHLQKVGAFKFRGACNAVMKLPEDVARRGVATHSSGNHAQALALAARLRGIPATIVMPSNSIPAKRRAVEEYGAKVVECAPTLAARESTAARVVAETGATLVPPYDHADVIAGQGTAALEMLAQVDDLDAIVAPVGGGGLAAGTCLAVRGSRLPVRVYAGEPKGADDAARSKAEGRLVLQTDPRTIADGLRTSLGELTWPVIRDRVEAILTVEEEEIVSAMRLAWERGKLLVEPTSAVAIAAVLTDRFRSLAGLERVGVILTGGNADLDALPWQRAR
jgi:threonine dehydratase/serine racemase